MRSDIKLQYFMRDLKTAFITFFPIKPNNMGSAAVVNSRFKSWPKNKKIFQISHIKNRFERSFNFV